MHPEFENRERWVKAMKEAAVAAVSAKENDDMPPVVDVLRKGKPAVTVMCRDVSRDQGLQAAAIAASGFAGDEIWLVLDSHMSNSTTNPVTGKKWGPGEMQAGCEGGDQMCATGIITDCMMIVRGTRDGDYQMSVLPYHVHKTERTIRWVDEAIGRIDPNDGENNRFDGIVLDGIKHAFATPTVKEMILADEIDLGVRLHADDIAKGSAIVALEGLGHEVVISG